MDLRGFWELVDTHNQRKPIDREGELDGILLLLDVFSYVTGQVLDMDAGRFSVWTWSGNAHSRDLCHATGNPAKSHTQRSGLTGIPVSAFSVPYPLQPDPDSRGN